VGTGSTPDQFLQRDQVLTAGLRGCSALVLTALASQPVHLTSTTRSVGMPETGAYAAISTTAGNATAVLPSRSLLICSINLSDRVELTRLELVTPCLQTRTAPHADHAEPQ
jgi:hypothetical protein